MRTEEIERYLTRQMTDDERDVFEQELREQPQLREDVKIVAWTIEAIRERGRQEDAERIRRMREQMDSDSKRYAATVAAAIGGVLVVAAMTAISIPPLYHHVIKPVIESVFGGSEKTEQTMVQQPLSTVSLDSLTSNNETGSRETDSRVEEGENTKPDEPLQAEEAATEERIEQQVVKEEDNKEDTPKPVVADEKREAEAKKEEKVKEENIITNNSSKVDERRTVGNTEYRLTRIDYDNNGNLVVYMSLLNNKENIDFDLSQMPTVNIDGYVTTAYRVIVDGATTPYFKLRKRQPSNLVIYFNGVKAGAKRIILLQVKNANEYKSLQIRNISIN